MKISEVICLGLGIGESIAIFVGMYKINKMMNKHYIKKYGTSDPKEIGYILAKEEMAKRNAA